MVKVLRKTLYERQVTLYESILQTGEALGVFVLTGPALTIANNLVALEDAYGHHIIAEVVVTRAQAERFLIDYASTATHCDLGPAKVTISRSRPTTAADVTTRADGYESHSRVDPHGTLTISSPTR